MLAQFVWEQLAEPLRTLPWTDWQGFWLARILDDRFVVVWFLPLLPVLLILRQQRLRMGIVLSGLTFVGYVFGVAYAGLWLLICLGLYRLGEWFAAACRRHPGGRRPVYVAAAVILGGYLVTLALQHVSLPVGWDQWLAIHAPWVFPLGARSVAWEPTFAIFRTRLEHGPLPLFAAVFYNAHNIGTAYLLCRMLAYFADLRRGIVPPERRSALHFLAYVCYAPALIQGPLERYVTFQEELDCCHERRGWRNVLPAAARIGWGIAKSVIASVCLLPVLWFQLGMGHSNDYYKHPERIASTWLLYCGVFLHIFWLYLEFSGYCDVSAGMARLLGYRQVENFGWPWLATSLRDFWRRWHISLSAILRDYIYIPLGGSRRRMVLNLCLTFAICGAWHPNVVRGACWGIVMGLMVALNHWWSDWMKRLDATPQGWLPAVRRAVLRLQPLPRIGAWLLTQHAFLFSILVFAGGTAAIRVPWEIARRLWTWWTTESGP